MKPYRTLLRLGSLGLLAVAVATGRPAEAGNYPAKQVMIITPAGAGSGPDVIGRIVADRLAQSWGQQVLIANRPGAGGLIAAQAASTARADGYMLYLAIASTFVVLPETQLKLPLDLQRDIVPIGLVAEQPMMIAVHRSESTRCRS